MNTLYDIKTRIIDLMNQENLTEEEETELKANINSELQSKSQGIVGYTRNIESTIDALDSEIKRLQAMKGAVENQLDKFKGYVKGNMEDLGIESIQTPIGAIKIKKNPASVEIIDEEQIPENYKKVKTTISIDKVAIKKAFTEDGEIVPGTKIVQDKTRLEIK